MGIWLVALLVVALVIYVRVAPSDPALWHKDVPYQDERTFPGGVVRIVPGDRDAFERLLDVAEKDGAVVLAGSAGEGHVTFVSRSKVMRFPDYTTVQFMDGRISIYGRLRFGKSDLGVNSARIKRWLAAAQL